ncbi:hypothetical protein D9619_011419 [Psilocybe cf. subviscida]|uniref:Uncharacterized protein n=1 Tax=Psilocybe cf. subviscida TaxID=2480587 RepID=A0A8H5F573_9AGAR|nr:hypothetical protein D9619_011419 [Psilocybe cf. subviscida]
MASINARRLRPSLQTTSTTIRIPIHDTRHHLSTILKKAQRQILEQAPAMESGDSEVATKGIPVMRETQKQKRRSVPTAPPPSRSLQSRFPSPR